MAARWICADLRSDGLTLGIGYSGWFRRRLRSSAEVAVPALPGHGPGSDAGAVAPALAEAVAAWAPKAGGRPEGVLLALPDRWFKIGLATPKAARGNVRTGEYVRWKLQADWNLETERIRHDWQEVRGRWGQPLSLLLVAAERAVVDAMVPVGAAAGAPVVMCVPRAVAAWNRMASGLRGDAAALLRDGDSFTFFGARRGTLAYIRSRSCESGSEREGEEAETLAHFREALGAGAPATRMAEWGGGAPVLEGLLLHPLVSGVFA